MRKETCSALLSRTLVNWCCGMRILERSNISILDYATVHRFWVSFNDNINDDTILKQISSSLVRNETSGVRGNDQGQFKHLQSPHPTKDTNPGQTLAENYGRLLVPHKSTGAD